MRHTKKKEYSASIPLLPVKEPKIGESYHLSWAKSHGHVWKLKSIIGNRVVMITPKTRRLLDSKLSDLRHTRRQQQRIEEGKPPYEIKN